MCKKKKKQDQMKTLDNKVYKLGSHCIIAIKLKTPINPKFCKLSVSKSLGDH